MLNLPGAVRRCLRCTLAVSALALIALGAPATAQEFPSRQVRIITPFPVGSGPEGVLRLVGDKLSKTWGKPVIIENRPGGNGFIAIDALKKAGNDGHDLIQLDSTQMTAYPHLFKKLPYDPQRDFEPVLPLFKNYFFVAVAANSPYKTMADLLADARAKPGVLNYGSWSVGNPVHLGSALLEANTNTKMTHVLYKETTQLYSGVANGEIAWALGSYASAGALQRAGKLRFLAVAAPQRVAGYTDVPTVAESGGPAGYEVSAWTALLAPKGTPRAVTDKIARDIEKILAEPEMREKYAAFAYEPFPQTREQFVKTMQGESARYAEIIKRAGASLD